MLTLCPARWSKCGKERLAAIDMRAEENTAFVREDERKFREEVQDGVVQLMRECGGTGRVSGVGGSGK